MMVGQGRQGASGFKQDCYSRCIVISPKVLSTEMVIVRGDQEPGGGRVGGQDRADADQIFAEVGSNELTVAVEGRERAESDLLESCGYVCGGLAVSRRAGFS